MHANFDNSVTQMKNSNNDSTHRPNSAKVAPALPASTIIPMDSFRPIPKQNITPEEDVEKKAMHTIYEQLKQAACCQDEERTKVRWDSIEIRFSRLQYKGSKKKITEKLDDENSYAPLHYAVRSNNKYVCEKLINDEYQCNVNLLGWAGQTPLHLAACSRQLEEKIKDTQQDSVLHILLKHEDIRVNMRDDKGRTALHHAIMRNRISICNILLSKGARVNIPDVKGATAFHYAYRYGKGPEMFSLFPLHQDLFQMKTIDNKSPFEWAAEYGHDDKVQQYLEKQSDTPGSNQGVRSLLHAAVRFNNPDTLSQLVPTEETKTYILNLACRELHGYKRLQDPKFSGFFDKNTMSTGISKEGFTPLMIAVKNRRYECIQILLNDNYCDKTILEKSSNDLERTVLHICAEYPDEAITDSLLGKVKQYGSNMTSVDVLGNTALHICAQKNNQYMCEKLLAIDQDQTLKMLEVRNNSGYTPFHEAINKGFSKIVEQMIKTVPDSKKLIDKCDDELQTSLHKAAAKGDVKIIDLMISHDADLHALDINDHTPLHEAVRSSETSEEENRDRTECIEHLISAGAVIDALNIHRESPLHIACRSGTSSEVKTLLHRGANLLQTNNRGFNCLEVAIEQKNKNTVQYLIDHDYIFELMRNAQLYESRREPCCTFGNESCHETCCIPCCKCVDRFSFYTCRMGLDRRTADTPMRKLIVTMPDMALAILEKCTTTIGSETSKIHRIFFDYEFLEDQYVIRNWAKGNLNSNLNSDGHASVKYDAIEKDEPYTVDYKTLVMNHPLFLMAVYNQYKLMAHPLSRSLVNQKFYGISLLLFLISFLLFAAFLGIFTTIVVRATQPQYYYSLTGFDFDYGLCQNVADALGTSNTALKETTDDVLKTVLYVFMILVLVKNIWLIIGYIRTSWTKIFTFLLELISLGFAYYFIFDYDFQSRVTMRCPNQWEVGACGLFLGYISLLYYTQYVPIFGIYVIMMKQILIRFLLFVPVLMIFLCAFGLTFFMVFQNFAQFSTVGSSLGKILLMAGGEVGYDDLLYNSSTTAYYKMCVVVLILLAIIMTILVSNLLVGLAVGEIGPMMDSAKNTRLDMLYELAADFEILKYQILSVFNRCCGCCFLPPRHYEQNDLTEKWKWAKNLKKELLESCAREFDKNDLTDEEGDDGTDYSTQVLEEVRKGIQELQPERPSSAKGKSGPTKAITGTGPKK
ncbi:unnamed protein product [Adineta steineri]|uniref:Ion transport domain-containing protein n=1 Tax=Adineta steineri TaxID=433720 RepID=A0A813XVT6_9BILA|nr:unnamed protein product [Adineta steineri]